MAHQTTYLKVPKFNGLDTVPSYKKKNMLDKHPEKCCLFVYVHEGMYIYMKAFNIQHNEI